MSLRLLRRRSLRESVAALAIAAYFLVALVPAGFMPSVDGIGWLKLCTAQGAVTVPGQGEPQSPAHDAGAACSFALAASFAAPPPVVTAFAPALRFVSTVPLSTAGATAEPQGPPRSQTPRGPPRSSIPT